MKKPEADRSRAAGQGAGAGRGARADSGRRPRSPLAPPCRLGQSRPVAGDPHLGLRAEDRHRAPDLPCAVRLGGRQPVPCSSALRRIDSQAQIRAVARWNC